jgi:16S rRNA (uracil1498-N3)-methyltransferase
VDAPAEGAPSPSPLSPHDIGPAAHVVVSNVAAPVLSADDFHHLARVRRLRAGEIVTVTDGVGNWRAARWTVDTRLGGDPETVLEPLGAAHFVGAPTALLTVGIALTKADKPEQTVTQLTEMGIGRIVLIAAHRSVVKWEVGKASKHRDRLRIAAREALAQSRGVWLPEVVGPLSLADTIEALGVESTALAEPGTDSITDPHSAPTALLIGPEGGWSDEERAIAVRQVALPGHVLRAPTAAVVGATMLLTWAEARQAGGGG